MLCLVYNIQCTIYLYSVNKTLTHMVHIQCILQNNLISSDIDIRWMIVHLLHILHRSICVGYLLRLQMFIKCIVVVLQQYRLLRVKSSIQSCRNITMTLDIISKMIYHMRNVVSKINFYQQFCRRLLLNVSLDTIK